MEVIFLWLYKHKNVVVLNGNYTDYIYWWDCLGKKEKENSIYITFFCSVISILIVFKYTNFIFKNLNVLLNKIQYDKQLTDQVNLLLPVGLSFIIFQACTYLGDVYKNNILAEKNIIRYAAFVAFFPTILAGPIQKSRKLLPQLHEPVFNGEQAKKGTI